ncbi:MAG TPA: DUF4959 domain-containing protein, partial [Anseongella sp.]|nr:DUF4959 domain-containing protein [Anseongella sp.]
MSTNKILFGSLFFLLALGACKKDQHKLDPLENDGIPPASISNVEVENLNGAVRITYTLPNDEDLLYVVAECETEKGMVQSKSSLYSNTLLMEGFGDTREREVALYAVDRGENRSEPVKVSVKPFTPPMQLVRNSMDIIEDFGGVKISFMNELESDLVISVLTPDSLGDWAEVETW